MQNLIIDTEWNQENVPYIRQKLREYNIKYLTDKDVDFVDEDFCFTIKDGEGHIFGGISGNTKLQSLFIQFLWVDESIQGKGFGRKLIKVAENFAVERKCRLIKVDTFSFQAPDFYKSLGFEVYGTIENFPEGHNHYFLYKRC
ncbi:N-acetyltransferase [Robertmurraya siralis]|uniref:N-acetyltransferase n=1 Tax=Robertmurraya siralis TaxID=77777 RepID=A0A920BVV6_9BACI|nr:GNAT family N-acetyltransferase [Robertmurraya siralis]PAE20803.1 GNAT family N-acetyltransferase [Bacillus sp. 7504-2]GIN63802.1 N-acetyltransferase [Robertmurraya siralis]